MKSFKAIFENGVFLPTENVDLPEGTTVRVVVDELAAILDMAPPGTSDAQVKI